MVAGGTLDSLLPFEEQAAAMQQSLPKWALYLYVPFFEEYFIEPIMLRIANEFDSNNFSSMAMTAKRFAKVCKYGGIPRVLCICEYLSKACREGKYHRVID